jgi:site-specific DNA-methyltransferase (cytosine-N4-specific)
MLYYEEDDVRLYHGDALSCLTSVPAVSVQTCVTSPPFFGLRDYGSAGQIGLESTPSAYAWRLVEVFRQVRRVLRDDGTLWLNLGDSYAGYHGNKHHELPTSSTNGWTRGYNENKRGDRRPQDIGMKQKDLIGIPWLVAFALRDDGWYLRADIVWSKPNPRRETVRDRPIRSHEMLFLFSKKPKYYYDKKAVGDNLSVWQIPIRKEGQEAHTATFPEALAERCLLGGSAAGSTVLDPFCGSGTTLAVARRLGRHAVGIDLGKDYLDMTMARLNMRQAK